LAFDKLLIQLFKFPIGRLDKCAVLADFWLGFWWKLWDIILFWF